jgi:hypothetical protein
MKTLLQWLKLVPAATAAVLIGVGGLTGCEREPADKIEGGFEDVGEGLEEGAEDVGREIEDAFD